MGCCAAKDLQIDAGTMPMIELDALEKLNNEIHLSGMATVEEGVTINRDLGLISTTHVVSKPFNNWGDRQKIVMVTLFSCFCRIISRMLKKGERWHLQN